MKRAPFLMIAAPLMLAGCSLAPKTVLPPPPVPQGWPVGDAYLIQSEAALPILSYNRENGKLWTTAGRAMITVEGMPFAFFTRVFALSVDNRLTVGVLGGFDGERSFWDPVVRDLLLGLKEKTTTL